MSFSQNLIHMIEQRSTNVKLAECCDCSNRQVRRYRNGATRPKLDLIIKMARCLDVDVGHLCFMDSRMFRIYYEDEYLKTFVEVEDNFIRNLSSLMDHKNMSVNDLAKYLYREDNFYIQYNRKKRTQYARRRRVRRLTKGITTYRIDDVVQISKVMECQPSRLLFGEIK